jgi:hypothetical protein
MDREYDIFELVDGTLNWCGHALGLLDARSQLQHVCERKKNECVVIHLPTKEVVARGNVRTADGRKPIIIQITYDARLSTARAETLRLQGYEVSTLNGNEAAKVVLSMPHSCDLFIIGHGASAETRNEMAAWLRSHYAGAKVLSVNAPATPGLAAADYNLEANGPETLLPVIHRALDSSRRAGAAF